MKKLFSSLFVILAFQHVSISQPVWPTIKANATFTVHDTSFLTPGILPLNIGGWEDGLYVTRDGKNLYSTFLPIDVFSWLGDLEPCLDFTPYFRPPLLGMDTVTNPFGCNNFVHSDIIYSGRADTSQSFTAWNGSNLEIPATFEGGACGVLLNEDTFDVFVFTRDIGSAAGMELFFMSNVSVNPNTSTAVQILSSPEQEDNPHIERLNDSTLLLFFDRERHIYYSLSYDNGITWEAPLLVTNVLNDQAPYDIQPHLWNDGSDWWMFFCADNTAGRRCIYKSKQMIAGDWNSWSPKQIVIEPGEIDDGNPDTHVAGIGEPTLTGYGDLYFVAIYADLSSADTTDVYDCDPWILPAKQSVVGGLSNENIAKINFTIYPNPAKESVNIKFSKPIDDILEIIDMSGRVLDSEPLNGQDVELDVSHLPGGMYLLKLKNNTLVIQKLIIE
ncbi:MAG: T9SS type A sorting domain-containing protein [Flavobacteriales bacterium]|nr:T9SS type A sorting domain-containing protein [Flavobacteriales bacterium]